MSHLNSMYQLCLTSSWSMCKNPCALYLTKWDMTNNINIFLRLKDYVALIRFKILQLVFPFLAHLAFRPCELLSSLFVRSPSVNISHFNLLLRNHWANCNQTLVEWFLDGPLSKLCPVIPTSNQDGRQAKNRKKGGWNFNCPLLL